MTFNGFNLQFPLHQMQHWADTYPREDREEWAFEAGRKIRQGDYSLQNLEHIVRWKSARVIAQFGKNTDAEIADALHLSIQAQQPRSAFGVLMGLSGVGAPMASAILTAIDQERYTIIDYRALQALGAPDLNADLRCYLNHYFPECQRLAHDAGVSLRTVDRALWSWSVQNEK
jgi:hypothetical protein